MSATDTVTFWKRFIEKIKNNKKLQFVFIITLTVVMLLVLFGSYSSETENINEDSVSEYVCKLEDKLSKNLSKIDGAGKVSVVINVESGTQTVLAEKTTITETVNGKETTNAPIVVNGKTVVLKEMHPKITGVLIVAEGASNISVRNQLQQATVTLLDIELKQIEIMKMK